MHLLLQKGFVLSMSRAGTPTDNGFAERFVGIFKLAIADRRPYHNLGAFLQAAQAWINFYNRHRPHEGLGNLSPQQFAQQLALENIPSITLVVSIVSVLPHLSCSTIASLVRKEKQKE
jgi:putative transposase